MFEGCVKLGVAPVLPAAALVDNCYNSMFDRCHALSHVTMLATDVSAKNCLYRWVREVYSAGTFVKAPEMESLPSGINGIPVGWTVKNYDEE